MTAGMYGRGIIIDPHSDDSENENEPADDERDAKKRKLEEAAELCKDEPTVQVVDPDKMNLDAAAHADALADNVDVNGAEVRPFRWGAPCTRELSACQSQPELAQLWRCS